MLGASVKVQKTCFWVLACFKGPQIRPLFAEKFLDEQRAQTRASVASLADGKRASLPLPKVRI